MRKTAFPLICVSLALVLLSGCGIESRLPSEPTLPNLNNPKSISSIRCDNDVSIETSLTGDVSFHGTTGSKNDTAVIVNNPAFAYKFYNCDFVKVEGGGDKEITAYTCNQVRAGKGSVVHAHGCKTVIALPGSTVHVYACNKLFALEGSTVYIFGCAEVEAHEKARVQRQEGINTLKTFNESSQEKTPSAPVEQAPAGETTAPGDEKPTGQPDDKSTAKPGEQSTPSSAPPLGNNDDTKLKGDEQKNFRMK